MIIVPEIYHGSTHININVVIIFLVAGTYLEKELPEVGQARSLHPSGYNVFFNEFTDGDDKVSTMLIWIRHSLQASIASTHRHVHVQIVVLGSFLHYS